MTKYLMICLALLLSNLSSNEADTTQVRYKMYCMYTPDFHHLFENYFLPNLKDDFELVVEEYPQECPSGTFRSEGWNTTMLRKLEMIYTAILDNWNQVFVYSDIDIIFLKPSLEALLNHLGDNDFVIQQGWPRNKICAGFFVMRGNEKTRKLIMTAYKLLSENVYVDDQLALQSILDNPNNGEIAWKFLPSEQFPNGGRVLKESNDYYLQESKIELHEDIILFHANCCIGIENKYAFLNAVQKEFFAK